MPGFRLLLALAASIAAGDLAAANTHRSRPHSAPAASRATQHHSHVATHAPVSRGAVSYAPVYRAPVYVPRVVLPLPRPAVYYVPPRVIPATRIIAAPVYAATAPLYPPAYLGPSPYGSTLGIDAISGWNWAPSSPQQIAQELNAQRAQAAQPIEFRYYCPDTRAYYPEAQQCPSDWLKVLINLPGG